MMLKEPKSDFNTWSWMDYYFLSFLHTFTMESTGVLFLKYTPRKFKKRQKAGVFFFGVSWRHQSSPGWDAIAIGFGHWSYAETCQRTGGTAVSQPRWADPYPLKGVKGGGFLKEFLLRKTYKTRWGGDFRRWEKSMCFLRVGITSVVGWLELK